MVRSITSPDHGSGSSKRLTILLMSVVALCAKHASRVSSKLRAKPGPMIKTRHNKPDSSDHKTTTTTTTTSPRSPLPPKSPLIARPKQLMTSISDKAITLMHNKKKPAMDDKDDDCFVGPHDEFGDGGVWQRTILMGDKCQPLDFSGAIYYDSKGKQLDEVPFRSPRASPLPGYLARRGDL